MPNDDAIKQMMRLLSPIDISQKIPPFPDCPPVGWTVSLAQSTVTVDAIVPPKTVDAIGEYVQTVQQSAGGN